MSRFWMLALACACGLALTVAPAPADDPKPPAKKVDSTEQILAALTQECVLKEGANINEIPLFELLQDLSKRHQVTFTILEEYFKAEGQPNIKEEKPKFAAVQLNGTTLHQFLTMTLNSIGATYLVKNGVIEIVPIRAAAEMTKSALAGDASRFTEPLVSAIFKEKPLKEAVAKIAEMYDLTVIVSPQAGEMKANPVTARILNMPADKAIELLAPQADLRVVRRGTAFLITTKDHAKELFSEKLEKERQKIEVEKMRDAKPPTPKPSAFKGGFRDPLNTGSIPFKGTVPFNGTLPTIPGLVPPALSVPKP